jgi:hypothetical protein
MGCEFVDWMHLAQDRDQRRGLVYMVMDLRAQQQTEEDNVLPLAKGRNPKNTE